MKKLMLVLIGLGAWLGCGAPYAQEAGSEIRDAAVKVAVTTCANCHGAQGRSINPKFPIIAGQHAGYLAAQLKNFKLQTRGDADAIGYMWGMSAPLSDELIDALAAYYSAQRPAGGERSDSVLVARGSDIYANGNAAEGIPPCASCHGPGALGTDDFPRLAGQHDQYLLKQLHSFRNNMRNVAVMHGVTAGLKSEEMQAVATYLQSLGG
jgi:cytochrome c553